MATDWGGSGDKSNGGDNGNGSGSIPCPVIVAGIIAIPVLVVKLFRK